MGTVYYKLTIKEQIKHTRLCNFDFEVDSNTLYYIQVLGFEYFLQLLIVVYECIIPDKIKFLDLDQNSNDVNISPTPPLVFILLL